MNKKAIIIGIFMLVSSTIISTTTVRSDFPPNDSWENANITIDMLQGMLANLTAEFNVLNQSYINLNANYTALNESYVILLNQTENVTQRLNVTASALNATNISLHDNITRLNTANELFNTSKSMLIISENERKHIQAQFDEYKESTKDTHAENEDLKIQLDISTRLYEDTDFKLNHTLGMFNAINDPWSLRHYDGRLYINYASSVMTAILLIFIIGILLYKSGKIENSTLNFMFSKVSRRKEKKGRNIKSYVDNDIDSYEDDYLSKGRRPTDDEIGAFLAKREKDGK